MKGRFNSHTKVVVKRSVNFVDCWPQCVSKRWLCHRPPGASACLWRDSSTLSCTSPLDRHTCTVTERLRWLDCGGRADGKSWIGGCAGSSAAVDKMNSHSATVDTANSHSTCVHTVNSHYACVDTEEPKDLRGSVRSHSASVDTVQ